MQTFRHYWESLRTSFWLLPAVMTSGAAGLALLAVWLDEHTGTGAAGWVYAGSPEGARHLLASVAGSMITVAGVVFSITIVALSLASNQFGSRLLRTFMRDRGNQIVLGTFIATYVYCLLVLRTVRTLEGREFVPQLAVTGAVVLALMSLGVLIYFIHHTAVALQAPTVVANVAQELDASIDALFPEMLGSGPPDDAAPVAAAADLPAGFDDEAWPVLAPADGYVQFVEDDRLLELAVAADRVLRIAHPPGAFVAAGDPLAFVSPPPRDEDLAAQFQRRFVLGLGPTPSQDLLYAVSQLVEIAVRALSPAMNDPVTAVACLDRLGAALGRLAARRVPSPYRYDAAGRLRVVAPPVRFPAVAAAAFGPIIHHGRSNPAVLLRVLDAIGAVLAHARRDADRVALRNQARLVAEGAAALPLEVDRVAIAARHEAVTRQVAPDSSR